MAITPDERVSTAAELVKEAAQDLLDELDGLATDLVTAERHDESLEVREFSDGVERTVAEIRRFTDRFSDEEE